MSSERDLSKHSCVVIIGIIGSITAIIVSIISIYAFMTGRNTLAETAPMPVQTIPTATTAIAMPVETPFEAETVPTPQEDEFVMQSFVPANSCPNRVSMVWLQYPNIWYGPFVNGDAISYGNFGGFSVWDADLVNMYGTFGSIIPYPDPYLQIPRNQWVPLNSSIFLVCVDGAGNVFGSTN